MKPSDVLRKAARFIEKNETYRRKGWSWEHDGPYYDPSVGMCVAISDIVWERAWWDSISKESLEERTKQYLVPFCPYKRVRWGNHWIKTFEPEDQQHRIIMLLMAADIAESEGN